MPFAIYASSRDAYTRDGVKRLAELGITDLVVGFRQPYVRGPDTEPLQKKLDALARYGDSVIAS